MEKGIRILFVLFNLTDHELGMGANPIYSSEARPAFSQLSFAQPAAAAVMFSRLVQVETNHANHNGSMRLTPSACLFLSALLDEMDCSGGDDDDR